MNSKNDIAALRETLFETLRGLKDGSVSPEKARAINETGQTIINTAKVEVEYLKQTGARAGTGFIAIAKSEHDPHAPEPTSTGVKLPTPGGYQHRMK